MILVTGATGTVGRHLVLELKTARLPFRVYLNASYLGKFYMPALSCEAMYNASIAARQPGKWVSVVSELDKTMSAK